MASFTFLVKNFFYVVSAHSDVRSFVKQLWQLNFETAQRFADAYARALCADERCCCAWTFSSRRDMVLGCLDVADGCGLLSWSRSRIVDHKVDIEVSCLKVERREALMRNFIWRQKNFFNKNQTKATKKELRLSAHVHQSNRNAARAWESSVGMGWSLPSAVFTLSLWALKTLSISAGAIVPSKPTGIPLLLAYGMTGIVGVGGADDANGDCNCLISIFIRKSSAPVCSGKDRFIRLELHFLRLCR